MEEKSEKSGVAVIQQNDAVAVADAKGQHHVRVAKTMLINLSFVVLLVCPIILSKTIQF